MDYVLLILTIIIFSIQTIAFKEFNRSHMKNLASYFLFNAVYFSLIVLIYLAVNQKAEPVSPLTFALGFCFGVCFVITILLFMKAMETGPLAYSSLLFSLALLVPVIFGAIFWQESINILQWLGLLLLFLTLVISSQPSSRIEGRPAKVNIRWLVFIIAALLGNGSLMTMSKAQQMLLPGREIEEFLIIAFGTAAVLSLILFFYRRIYRKEKTGHLKNRPMIILVLVASTTTAFGNQIGLYLSGRLPAVIQFPTVSGGIVLLSSILAVVLYKERFTRAQSLGLVTGLAAIILLSLR